MSPVAQAFTCAITCAVAWIIIVRTLCQAGVMNLKSLAQDAAVAVAGAVVPLLPLLLEVPPAITPRDLLRSALSAACAVAALYVRKYKPSVEPK